MSSSSSRHLELGPSLDSANGDLEPCDAETVIRGRTKPDIRIHSSLDLEGNNANYYGPTLNSGLFYNIPEIFALQTLI